MLNLLLLFFTYYGLNLTVSKKLSDNQHDFQVHIVGPAQKQESQYNKLPTYSYFILPLYYI